ncbi:MAK10-like protein [Tanacetum coccineum]
MASHTERIERFENAIFKHREDINDIMAEMFGLVKELSASRTPKKVLIREEARHPTTKHVNSISLIRIEEEYSVKNNEAIDKSVVEPSKSDEEEPPIEVDKTSKIERRTNDKLAKSAREKVTKNKEEEPTGVSSSQAVGYYLKHKINEKLIEGLIENLWFNDSLSATRVGKMKRKTYDLLLRGPMHDAILKKKIPKRRTLEEILKYCLIDERPAETDIRLSLASHLYIYPLGIAEDVLVEVAGYVYPVDFVILDIKEDEKRSFILGTSLLTTAKAVFKFDKGMITLRSRKNKAGFRMGKKNKTSPEEGDGVRPMQKQ